MKTTNYEISKQLAEAGFAYDYDCGYTHKGKLIDIQEQMGAYHIETPSFCFETIWEALPEVIRNNEILNLRKNEIGYYFWDTDEEVCLTGFDKQENESLADTAARLWLKLKEKNLI